MYVVRIFSVYKLYFHSFDMLVILSYGNLMSDETHGRVKWLEALILLSHDR